MTEDISRKNFGLSLMDVSITDPMRKLWEGPIRIDDLNRIEIGLRSFIVSKRLSFSRIQNLRTRDFENLYSSSGLQAPFGDGVLDYEFEHIETKIDTEKLPGQESDFLASMVEKEIRKKVDEFKKIEFEYEEQAYDYVEDWYLGYSSEECSESAKIYPESGVSIDEDGVVYLGDRYDENTFFHQSNLRMDQLRDLSNTDAKFLVECHRAGITVYSDSPVAKICEKHIFSEWPNKLFESFGEEYMNVSRELRGPGIAVDLPPLISLVLSRASRRCDIPRTIVDLREEYGKHRVELWNILQEMWTTDDYSQQINILRNLQNASSSIFEATYPKKMDVLSLALDVSSLSLPNIGKSLLQHDKPKSRVSAISFTEKLSLDFKGLLNSRVILRRHFSDSELKGFGVL